MTDLALRPLGQIVRLQLQRSSLKLGEKPNRWYDPSPLLAVDTLTLTPKGALGRTEFGEPLLDIHHADHPATRNNGTNDISVGFTGHYAAMRARFGPHLPDGIAGENILVESSGIVQASDLGGRSEERRVGKECKSQCRSRWPGDRKSTRLNSSHKSQSRMPSSA